MNRSAYIFLFLFCSFCAQLLSQSILFPQDYFFEQTKKQFLSKRMTDSSCDECALMKSINPTHIFPSNTNEGARFDSLHFYKPGGKWLVRKLTRDNWVDFKTRDTIAGEVTDFRLIINPIFNFQAGKTNDTGSYSSIYTNTRGLLVQAMINNNLKLETAFMENQSVFDSYISANVAATRDVLGQGRWKTFKTHGYDYAMASGVLWWKPSRYFELYAGHGKQKIGNGYRSILLSDQAFNYPYLRFDLNFEKIRLKYTSTYALLMNLTPTAASSSTQFTPFGTEALLQKKPFSYQYLRWTPHPRISMALFQGMVWQPSDARNKLDISVNYFNPVMFVNPAIYGFSWYPKILMGFDLQAKVTQKLFLYAQVATDGKKASYANQTGFGMQAGFKAYDAFTLKNFFLQGEYNTYRNNLYYANSSMSVANYNHYNRFLTLPTYLSNGNEFIGIAAYRYKRLMITGKANLLMYYNDPKAANYLTNIDGKLSFIVNPSNNMNVALGMQVRNSNTSQHNNPMAKGTVNEVFYVSFRTSLYNIYTDL